MKKILVICILSVFASTLFSQTTNDRQVPFHVADSTTNFNASLIDGTIIFDEESNKLWRIDQLGYGSDNLSTVSKTLLLDPSVGGADGNGIYSGSGVVPTSTVVTITDNINFDSGLLYLNSTDNIIGIGNNGFANTKLNLSTTSSSQVYAGAFSNGLATGSFGYGVRGVASSGTASINIGVSGEASSGSDNWGVRGLAQSSTGSNKAIVGTATGTATTNIGGYFESSGGTNNYAIVVPSGKGDIALGTTVATAKTHIVGNGTDQTTFALKIQNFSGESLFFV
ncbi:MAG: hypothetical protein KC589_09360, partial [Nanoarchaeota archaeon]|nr:hypothetical protein [Nanoarchaeota archaeon]